MAYGVNNQFFIQESGSGVWEMLWIKNVVIGFKGPLENNNYA
jgi:hypothetical protein